MLGQGDRQHCLTSSGCFCIGVQCVASWNHQPLGPLFGVYHSQGRPGNTKVSKTRYDCWNFNLNIGEQAYNWCPAAPSALSVQFSSVPQLCPTPCDPLDYSPPGSSVHGISQARVIEWVAIYFSRGIFLTQASYACLVLCRQILYH